MNLTMKYFKWVFRAFIQRIIYRVSSGVVTVFLLVLLIAITTNLKTMMNALKSSDDLNQVSNFDVQILEKKKSELIEEIKIYQLHVENLRKEHVVMQGEIQTRNLNTTYKESNMANREIPIFRAKDDAVDTWQMNTHILAADNSKYCRMYACFDYSRCSLFEGFPVFIYNIDALPTSVQVTKLIKSALSTSPHFSEDPKNACVFIAVFGEELNNIAPKNLQKILVELPHWNKDGRNHILLNVAETVGHSTSFSNVNTSRAIVAQTSFLEFSFREKFDIVLPPGIGKADSDIWSELSALFPIRRKYFLSFWGQFKEFDYVYRSVEYTLIERLKSIQSSSSVQMDFRFACDGESNGLRGEWMICENEEKRAVQLKQTTFALNIAPGNISTVTTETFQIRLYETLKYGAIPVILGESMELPFSEILDWNQVAIVLHKSRVNELYVYLNTFTDSDIIDMKRNARILFETYLSSTEKIMNSLLAVVRTRLRIPTLTTKTEYMCGARGNASHYLQELVLKPGSRDGRLEDRGAHPLQTYNHSFSTHVHREIFNRPGDPFRLFPVSPFGRRYLSEANSGFDCQLSRKVYNVQAWGFNKQVNVPFVCLYGRLSTRYSSWIIVPYRQTNRTLTYTCSVELQVMPDSAIHQIKPTYGNGTRNISNTDTHGENFTVVMLTYQRTSDLHKSLQWLKGLPNLDKVVMVWNNPFPPSEEIQWPDIGVPLHVMVMSKNSLNNRFLPFDAIETEAVLSLDDDSVFSHEEIAFAFRVWKHERDRIVGFPGRIHIWDTKTERWLYKADVSCEISMVLTGGAFIHKYYMSMYSYSMTHAIREKVDQHMNCEDIAMNFLISHITGKSPIKVTSKWGFASKYFPKRLSGRGNTHYERRHDCINFFYKVYGYLPLVSTPYRVVSVLFKNYEIPGHPKCYDTM